MRNLLYFTAGFITAGIISHYSNLEQRDIYSQGSIRGDYVILTMGEKEYELTPNLARGIGEDLIDMANDLEVEK